MLEYIDTKAAALKKAPAYHRRKARTPGLSRKQWAHVPPPPLTVSVALQHQLPD